MVNSSELGRRAQLVGPWFSALLLLAASGCNDPTEPRIGAIQSKARVTGAGTLAVRVVTNVEFDPNGYSLSVDGAVPKFVPAVFPGYEREVIVSGLTTGAHSLSVTGLAGHCVASPQSPIAFAVSGGTSTEVKIGVLCLTHGWTNVAGVARGPLSRHIVAAFSLSP